jgi:hypothetical protein
MLMLLAVDYSTLQSLHDELQLISVCRNVVTVVQELAQRVAKKIIYLLKYSSPYLRHLTVVL